MLQNFGKKFRFLKCHVSIPPLKKKFRCLEARVRGEGGRQASLLVVTVFASLLQNFADDWTTAGFSHQGEPVFGGLDGVEVADDEASGFLPKFFEAVLVCKPKQGDRVANTQQFQEAIATFPNEVLKCSKILIRHQASIYIGDLNNAHLNNGLL